MTDKTMNVDQLREKLVLYGQDHLLQFWNDISDKEQEHLYEELEELNYEQILRYFKACMAPVEKVDEHLEPVPEEVFGSYANTDAQVLKNYETEGELIFPQLISVDYFLVFTPPLLYNLFY